MAAPTSQTAALTHPATTSVGALLKCFPTASPSSPPTPFAPSGGSATADAVTSAAVSGDNVVLNLTSALPTGTITATITAEGQNPLTPVTPPGNNVIGDRKSVVQGKRGDLG